MRRSLTASSLTAALTIAAALAVPALRAEEGAEAPQQVRKVVRFHHSAEGGALPDLATLEGDRVLIEDLAELLPGESRSYSTESGREVVVTRIEGEVERAATAEKEFVVIAPHGARTAGEEGGEPPVIVEIVDEAEGKVERRIIVLRLDEPAAE